MNRQNLFIFNSKNSLLKIVIKFCTFFILMMAFFWNVVSPQYVYNYQASLIDKMERLETTNAPKIVLVGHSSLAFGIRSELIEDATGMKVVNMGLHGGLGNAFHEEMAKVNINEGDIVVICHSDFAGDETIDNASLAWTTIENHFDLWTCVPTKEWYDMLLAFPTYVKKCTNLYLTGQGNLSPEGAYSRTAFNEYGDNIYSATHEGYYTFAENYVSPIPSIDDECTDRLNALNEYITSRGGTLLIGGYPIAYTNEYPNEEEWIQFKENLQKKLDFPIICDYTDYFYPQNYFYDTNLHLTDEAAVIRTNQMIEDLTEYLNNPSYVTP